MRTSAYLLLAARAHARAWRARDPEAKARWLDAGFFWSFCADNFA